MTRTIHAAVCAIALGVASGLALPAHATIIGGAVTGGSSASAGGVFVKVFPSPGAPDDLFNVTATIDTVGDNNQQSHNLWGFDEDQNIVLPTNFSVDILAPGGSLGVLTAGTLVASHYVYYDPVNANIEGWVDFDAPILAILTSTTNMNATDFLANTGVTYLNPGLRGLESVDFAGIDAGNPYRVNIDFTASNPGDYIRVLTAFSPSAVPAPGALALLGLGMLSASVLRRRSK
ncbi:MAG: PEP-CTERM sorting domain-containing protein [Rhodobacteraceae bacterium]|nr:PEP-CTERM sorting domain-containing protein [Paracoccaceae bacterium]